MTNRICWPVLLALFLHAPVLAADELAANTQLAPELLRQKCLTCHGADKQEGGLRLDSTEALLKGGDRGTAVSIEAPEESLIVSAVRGADADLVMPPDERERLSAEQITLLAEWIKAGAKWPSGDADRPELASPQASRRLGDAWTDRENPVVKTFRGDRLDLWSLRKIAQPALPAIADLPLGATEIDRFILARLHEQGLTLSPEADRRTLIRRLAYDLTGLPPTPEETKAFTSDSDPQAYDNLVERLLASPRYGERMARHWLDVVRYADTEGFERDEYRPTIYRYRDYVIRSFQSDKPYDLFLREQLSGDEMTAGQPMDETAVDRLVATGYLRLGPRDSTADIFDEIEKSRDQLMGDLANTTGEAMLGLTMSCCQCHDHKYDPLLQADHFRLRAFFAGIQLEDALPISVDAERQEIDRHNETIEAELMPVREAREALVGEGKTAARTAGSLAADAEVTEEAALAALTEEQRAKCTELANQIAEIEKRKRELTTGWCAVSAPGEPPATHIFFQGDHRQPRDVTPPGFLSVFDPNPATFASAESSGAIGRRTALADWIASPNNPLTARVMVNRVWAQHFGHGIVATPNDFGYSGDSPTHPELLDWLANEFVSSGWSVKHLHRLIVQSAAYRQSSGEHPQGEAADAENRLLWRQNPKRFDAESLRDALLAVSGKLLPVDSGPPKWPSIPEFIRRTNPAALEENGRLQNWYPTVPEEETFVRSIFIVQKRSIPVPFLQPFDIPESNRSCARRDVTTVAPQASTLMNSPFALAMAEGFARRVALRAGEDDPSRVRLAFRLAFAREAEAGEAAAAAEMLSRHAEAYRASSRGEPELDALVDLCRALYSANEFIYID